MLKSYYGINFINSIDINECKLYNDTCSMNASCINSEGSFSCLCLPGYTGDGFELCTGMCRKCHYKFPYDEKNVKSLIKMLIYYFYRHQWMRTLQ